MLTSELVARFNAKPEGDHWRAHCPAHKDPGPSLMISRGDKPGYTVVNCHAGCTPDAVCAAVGLTPRDLCGDGASGNGLGQLVAKYDYEDANGVVRFQIRRHAPKTFRAFHPDGLGGWAPGMNGGKPMLYHLPEVLAGVRAGKVIWVVEGEKDVEALRARRKVATCNPFGADRGNGKSKWRPEFAEVLRGARVAVIADKDDTGRAHALQIMRSLDGIATAKVYEAAVGNDISDHLKAGKKLSELVAVSPLPAKSQATATPEAPSVSPWDRGQAAPDYCAVVDPELSFLEARLLLKGAVTQFYSPRGLGKTHIGHALAKKLAHLGRSVLLLDRDNPPREIRRRLKGWKLDQEKTLTVFDRNDVPPLTDAEAWASFPVERWDIVIVDSWDSSTEGIGEQSSEKPGKAMATLLNVARKPNGPAFLALGNTVRTGAHSRGSGTIEDRADIVFEVRDATGVIPTGTKPWWQELPPAGAEAWG